MLEAHIADAKRTQRQHIQGRTSAPETLDPVPMEGACQGPPGPVPMAEQIQAMIREEISVQAAEQDMGTFEQEDDFVEEDADLFLLSGFEVTEVPMEEEIPVEDASPPPESPQDESNSEAPASATPPTDAPASVPEAKPPTLPAATQ